MDEHTRKRLDALKQAQRQRECAAKLASEKQRLASEIPYFSDRYRFSDAGETGRIEAFLNTLPALTPVRPDLSALTPPQRLANAAELLSQGDRSVFICFLCGSEELIHLFPYSSIQNFVDDFETWRYFSSYLLLLFDDMQEFIYIDDHFSF